MNDLLGGMWLSDDTSLSGCASFAGFTSGFRWDANFQPPTSTPVFSLTFSTCIHWFTAQLFVQHRMEAVTHEMALSQDGCGFDSGAVCMFFPVSTWVPSKCSQFLPQSKDTHINLISNSKLNVHVNVSLSLLVIFLLVVLWQTWQPVQSFCGPSPRDSCDLLLHLHGCPSWSCGGKKTTFPEAVSETVQLHPPAAVALVGN